MNLPIPFLGAYFLIGEDIARIRHFEIGEVEWTKSRNKGDYVYTFPISQFAWEWPFPEYANHSVTIQ